MKLGLSLIAVIMATGLCSFAQVNFDEVSLRNDLKNTVVQEINRARHHYGVKPVILADKYSLDANEAVAILYANFSTKDVLMESDYIDVHNDITYKGRFPSGGRGMNNTILFFYSEKEMPRFLKMNLRRFGGSTLTDPDARFVSVSILEDQLGQLYVAIMSYY